MNTMPSNIELEARVLYGCIRSIDVAEYVMTSVSDKHFYQPKNKTLYNALRTVFDKSGSCDVSSVAIELERKDELQNYGGEIGLIEKIFETTIYATAEAHVQQLHEYKVRRQLIDDAQDIIVNALDPEKDAFAVADYAHEKAIEATVSGGAIHTRTVDELIEDYENGEHQPFELTDEEMKTLIYSDGGCQPGHVEVTIAESGHGKTRYAMYKTMLLARNGYRTHWFQLEDFGGKTAKRFKQMCGDYANNILITTEIQDVDDIKREARRIKRDFNTHNIVIDYVQEVTTKSRSRAEEVEQIARQLTRLAMELNVMMHLTSQMTIADGTRKKWKLEPRVNDVRWSKQLKQAAHVITSVFRPSQIEELQNGEMVYDWSSGTLPKNIVVVRAIKSRDADSTFKPMLLYDTDNGMVSYKAWQAETYENNNAWRNKAKSPKIITFDEEEPF